MPSRAEPIIRCPYCKGENEISSNDGADRGLVSMRELRPQCYAIGFRVQVCLFEVRHFSVVWFSRLVVERLHSEFPAHGVLVPPA